MGCPGGVTYFRKGDLHPKEESVCAAMMAGSCQEVMVALQGRPSRGVRYYAMNPYKCRIEDVFSEND